MLKILHCCTVSSQLLYIVYLMNNLFLEKNILELFSSHSHFCMKWYFMVTIIGFHYTKCNLLLMVSNSIFNLGITQRENICWAFPARLALIMTHLATSSKSPGWFGARRCELDKANYVKLSPQVLKSRIFLQQLKDCQLFKKGPVSWNQSAKQTMVTGYLYQPQEILILLSVKEGTSIIRFPLTSTDW